MQSIKNLMFVIVVTIVEVQCIFFLPSNVMVDKISRMVNTSYMHTEKSFNSEYPYSKGRINTEETYDFIIVGSGPAGSVLANRLSEVSGWKILLLEAGKPENLFTDIPGLCGLFQLTSYSWPYKMVKQEGACLAMEDQQCAWPRGKALGGTSVINYMIYTRGNKLDFNKWEAQGNPGWGWRDVVPYYIRSENANLEYSDKKYHGKDGFLDVEDVRHRSPLVQSFIDAGKELGADILDYNGKNQFGFSKVQANTRRGSRCSAAKAFIKPVEKRRNLRILPMSRVTEVLIDPNTKTAYGVKYLRNKKEYRAYARKEVILSAGAFASPQILMLSGIGPRDHLQELGINVIKDSPVGQFLQDHLTFIGLTFLVNSTRAFTLDYLTSPEVIFEYIKKQTGPLTSIGGVEALGYIKTSQAKYAEKYPDIELIFLPASLQSDRGGPFREGLQITKDFYNSVFSMIENRPCWTVLPMLLHPKSTGHLKLKSKNIFHHPLLYGNYFTDPEGHDLETMVAAIKEIIRLSKTNAFQKFGSTLHEVPFPTCKQFEFGTDDYWRCAVRSVSPSLHHQVGTCRMGPKDDPGAVVDSTLKVYGIKKLRVVDTSIIPFALSAHTNAPSFMIGEKAADMIKLEWSS